MTAAVGRERERSRGEGEDGGESGGAVGAIQTALAGLSAAPRKLAGRRWHGRVCAHGEHTLGALWRGGDDDWQRQSAGPVQMGRQVSAPGRFSLSLSLWFFYLLMFSIFCNWF